MEKEEKKTKKQKKKFYSQLINLIDYWEVRNGDYAKAYETILNAFTNPYKEQE